MPANNKKYNIEHLRKHAENLGGKCLSISYSTQIRKYIWVCGFGHKWAAKWKIIKYDNTWCPTCAKTSKPTISELQQKAINNGGKLLSNEYANCGDKLQWECALGHIWEACWNNIKQDRWCPRCSTFKTELKVKSILEQLLSVQFNKHRFYYNNRKYYEVDGYNKDLRLAFEYNGYQHYIYPNRYHKDKSIFTQLQSRDKEKEQYCRDNNIKLIVISYKENNSLKQYLEKE